MHKSRFFLLLALAIVIVATAIILAGVAFEPPLCLHFFNPKTGAGVYYGYCSWIGTQPVWMFPSW